VVALANEQKPDVILLTGDYVITKVIGGRYMPIEATVAKLRALTAPMGVYAVLGNHDDVDDPIKIADAFEQAGIRVLQDKAAELEQDDGSIYLIGFKNFFDGPVMNVVPANVPPGAHVLCFTHSPDVFPLLPSNCALTIAGHTHGGQVLLPFLGRLIVPSRYGQRYGAGVIRENGKTLFVSTGIGTSFIPVRFGVPPEVSILELR
jgi:predicted MPP superfamily phosphohydrolase